MSDKINRETVEQKLRSQGYEHPEEIVIDFNPYKIYSETGQEVYRSQKVKTAIPMSVCPECGEISVKTYSKSEFGCGNNHFWYLDEAGVPVADKN